MVDHNRPLLIGVEFPKGSLQDIQHLDKLTASATTINEALPLVVSELATTAEETALASCTGCVHASNVRVGTPEVDPIEARWSTLDLKIPPKDRVEFITDNMDEMFPIIVRSPLDCRFKLSEDCKLNFRNV